MDKLILYPLFFLALVLAAGVYVAFHALGWAGVRLQRLMLWLTTTRLG